MQSLLLTGGDYVARAWENWDVLLGGSAALWMFSAFVDALPEPRPNEGRLYLFFYRFVHGLAANIRKAKGQPQEPPK